MAISKISMCLCLAFVILAASRFDYISATESSSAEESESREFVVTLDHSNFTDFVAKHKFIVVDFYAPWCMFSKRLAPEYEKAASLLSKTDPQVVLAKVDAIDQNNKPLVNEYKIRGFPTLKILRYGGSAVQGYYGPRDADGIVSYMKKQSGPASVELKSPEEVTSIIESDKILVVGVFPEFSGESFENFTTLADRLRDDREFGHTKDAKLLPHGDISSGEPFVRLFKPLDELVVDFQEFDVNALVKFVEETSIPTLSIFDKDPKHHPFVVKYLHSPNAMAILFLNFTNGQFDAFQPKYNNVAVQYKGQGLIFRIGDVEGGEGAFQYFGIKEDQVPLIIIQKTDGEKYLKPNVEPDQIESWVKDFKDGNVQPYKKSEPVPDTNDEPVKVVVGDSMQEMVLSSAKNALLEFYAPWCGHCKKLAPILGEVAVSFENDPDVIIAKIDATANDIPHETFDVKGYPTLYFKSSSGNVVQYNGDKTKEDMIDFIQKHRDTVAKQGSRKSCKKGGSSTLSLQNIYSPVILKFFQVFGELFNYKVKQNPSIASKYRPGP